MEILPADDDELIIPVQGAPTKTINGVKLHPHKGDTSSLVAVDRKALNNIRNKERQEGIKEGLALNPKMPKQKRKLPKKKFDMHPVATLS